LKEFRLPVRVYYEDTDAGGVVYYANYLKFMERARTEWLRSLGFEQDELRQTAGIVFAVSRVEVDYLSPARFNEALTAVARVVRLGRASIDFEQVIEHSASNRVAARGRVKVVCLDAERFRPKSMPNSLQERLRSVL
jgi:acyl-CoA thioester hydrolase